MSSSALTDAVNDVDGDMERRIGDVILQLAQTIAETNEVVASSTAGSARIAAQEVRLQHLLERYVAIQNKQKQQPQPPRGGVNKNGASPLPAPRAQSPAQEAEAGPSKAEGADGDGPTGLHTPLRYLTAASADALPSPSPQMPSQSPYTASSAVLTADEHSKPLIASLSPSSTVSPEMAAARVCTSASTPAAGIKRPLKERRRLQPSVSEAFTRSMEAMQANRDKSVVGGGSRDIIRDAPHPSQRPPPPQQQQPVPPGSAASSASLNVSPLTMATAAFTTIATTPKGNATDTPLDSVGSKNEQRTPTRVLSNPLVRDTTAETDEGVAFSGGEAAPITSGITPTSNGEETSRLESGVLSTGGGVQPVRQRQLSSSPYGSGCGGGVGVTVSPLSATIGSDTGGSATFAGDADSKLFCKKESAGDAGHEGSNEDDDSDADSTTPLAFPAHHRRLRSRVAEPPGHISHQPTVASMVRAATMGRLDELETGGRGRGSVVFASSGSSKQPGVWNPCVDSRRTVIGSAASHLPFRAMRTSRSLAHLSRSANHTATAPSASSVVMPSLEGALPVSTVVSAMPSRQGSMMSLANLSGTAAGSGSGCLHSVREMAVAALLRRLSNIGRNTKGSGNSSGRVTPPRAEGGQGLEGGLLRALAAVRGGDAWRQRHTFALPDIAALPFSGPSDANASARVGAGGHVNSNAGGEGQAGHTHQPPHRRVQVRVQLDLPRPRASGLLAKHRRLREEQNYVCMDCLDTMRPQCSSLRRGGLPSWDSARYCSYTGLYFCLRCHRNDRWVIPARLLRDWDATPFPVSTIAHDFLLASHAQPLWCVSAVRPFLLVAVPSLRQAHALRVQLAAMRDLGVRCPEFRQLFYGEETDSTDFFSQPCEREANASHAHHSAFQNRGTAATTTPAAVTKAPARIIPFSQRYYVEDTELWSMADMLDLHRCSSTLEDIAHESEPETLVERRYLDSSSVNSSPSRNGSVSRAVGTQGTLEESEKDSAENADLQFEQRASSLSRSRPRTNTNSVGGEAEHEAERWHSVHHAHGASHQRLPSLPSSPSFDPQSSKVLTTLHALRARFTTHILHCRRCRRAGTDVCRLCCPADIAEGFTVALLTEEADDAESDEKSSQRTKSPDDRSRSYNDESGGDRRSFLDALPIAAFRCLVHSFDVLHVWQCPRCGCSYHRACLQGVASRYTQQLCGVCATLLAVRVSVSQSSTVLRTHEHILDAEGGVESGE